MRDVSEEAVEAQVGAVFIVLIFSQDWPLLSAVNVAPSKSMMVEGGDASSASSTDTTNCLHSVWTCSSGTVTQPFNIVPATSH